MAGAMVKLEFDVQLESDTCSHIVKSAFADSDAVQNVTVDLKGQRVLVETSLPSSIVQQKIEATGRKAVLKGLGPTVPALDSKSEELKQTVSAAVSALSGPNGVMGVVRFLQVAKETCLIDGTVDGLPPGEHGLHVYEYGDISKGCESLGNHYNPTHLRHGGPADAIKHAGDFGNVIADGSGRATFRMEVTGDIRVDDIIGRSLGISADRDDLGIGSNPRSSIDGNCGKGVACGIIARSAGIFENPKRICACSGRTIWEEREEVLRNKAANL